MNEQLPKRGLVTSELWLGVGAGYGVYEIATGSPTMPQAVCALGLALVASAYTVARAWGKRRA